MTYKAICECDNRACRKQYAGRTSRGYKGQANAPRHWLRVKLNGRHLHFCSYSCLSTWATAQTERSPEPVVSAADARKVPCPTCGAGVGERCKIVHPNMSSRSGYRNRTPRKGNPTTSIHLARKGAVVSTNGKRKKVGTLVKA